MQYLLSKRAELNSVDSYSYCTPLILACWKRQLSIINLLLDQRENINHPNRLMDTTLHYAVWVNNNLHIERGGR